MSEAIEVYLDGGWVKGTEVSTSQSRVFQVTDLSGRKWAIRIPRYQRDKEKMSTYSARCWQQARLERKLAEQTLSSLPIAEAILVPVRFPDYLFIDLIDASDIEHSSVDGTSLDTPYPFWATARPWAEGVPLLPSNVKVLPIARLGCIILDLATLFHKLVQLDILYLPMGEHILILEGRVSQLLSYGQAAYVWDDSSYNRFISGFYGQTVNTNGKRVWEEEIGTQGEENNGTQEHLNLRDTVSLAMCSFGEYLWYLSEAYQCRTDTEKELREGLRAVGTRAWANQYVDWLDMLEDLTETVDPSDSSGGVPRFV
jgi:hypothetical protein